MQITTMTEIQHKTFEAASSGRDVLGRARTGTGKTLAFLLPAIENSLRLGRVPGPAGYVEAADEDAADGGAARTGGIATLVLSPTRELAMQIHQQAAVLASSHANGVDAGGRPTRHRMRSQVMYGGSSRRDDLKKMEDGAPFVLCATPGRLIDHMENSRVRGTPFKDLIADVSVVVLDEADRCLDMGFRKDMEYILGVNGRRRSQTLLFSATLPKDLRTIMASHMDRDYLTVDCVHDIDPATHTNARVDQAFVTLPPSGDRWIAGLVDLIQDIHATHKTDHKVIVFFPTTNMCAFFSGIFNKIYRIPALEIHSKKNQTSRTRTSDRFRKRRTGLLFTTDVSARGVDYPDVTHVIQYGSAECRETYIHRLGRTGRAGKKGQGLIIMGSPEEQHQFVGGALQGLDVTRDKRAQRVLEGAERGDDGDDRAEQRRQGNVERLARVRSEVATPGSDLQKAASHAYKSLLGYHATKTQNLGMTKQQMVNHVNDLARQMGFAEGKYPALNPKVVQTLKLRGIPGVNVAHDQGSFGGSRGGYGNDRGRGGYGGGGGGYGGGGYGHGGGRGGGRGRDGGYGHGRSSGNPRYDNPNPRYDRSYDGGNAWSDGGGRGGSRDGGDRGYDRGSGDRGYDRGGGRRPSSSHSSPDQRWDID